MAITRSLSSPAATVALVAAFSVTVLGFVAGLVVLGDHSFEYYAQDPASTLDASRFVGLLSHAGVLLGWGAGFACVFAGVLVAYARGWREGAPLLVLGAGTAYLAIDDLFRVHEDLLPRLRIEEDLIFLAYVLAAVALLWLYRGLLREHEWPILALALGSLGVSVAFDQKLVDLGAATNRWIEDGIKVFGLALLALYLVRISARVFLNAQPLGHPQKGAAPQREWPALLGAGATTVLTVALCSLLVGAVAILVAVDDHPFRYYTKDPASTLSGSPLVGLVSHVGVLVAWGAGFTAVFAGGLVAWARGWRRAAPLLVTGAGMAFFAIDDLLLLHGGLSARLGIDDEVFFLGYVVLAAAFLWRYRGAFQRERPLLALALAVLAGWLFVDLAVRAGVFDESLSRLADSLQLAGIVCFATVLLRLAARAVADAYPLVVESVDRPAAEPMPELATDSAPTRAAAPRA